MHRFCFPKWPDDLHGVSFVLNGLDSFSEIKTIENADDLEDIGIEVVSHRKKIMTHIRKMKQPVYKYLNKADKEELLEIKGIGCIIADNIIKARKRKRFKSNQDRLR